MCSLTNTLRNSPVEGTRSDVFGWRPSFHVSWYCLSLWSRIACTIYITARLPSLQRLINKTTVWATLDMPCKPTEPDRQGLSLLHTSRPEIVATLNYDKNYLTGRWSTVVQMTESTLSQRSTHPWAIVPSLRKLSLLSKFITHFHIARLCLHHHWSSVLQQVNNFYRRYKNYNHHCNCQGDRQPYCAASPQERHLNTQSDHVFAAITLNLCLRPANQL